MNRIVTTTILTLPLLAAAFISKPASAQETYNVQLHRASNQPEYVAQYNGRYQQRRVWVAGHYEYRNHRRVWVPGHYVYR